MHARHPEVGAAPRAARSCLLSRGRRALSTMARKQGSSSLVCSSKHAAARLIFVLVAAPRLSASHGQHAGRGGGPRARRRALLAATRALLAATRRDESIVVAAAPKPAAECARSEPATCALARVEARTYNRCTATSERVRAAAPRRGSRRGEHASECVCWRAQCFENDCDNRGPCRNGRARGSDLQQCETHAPFSLGDSLSSALDIASAWTSWTRKKGTGAFLSISGYRQTPFFW
jgi:hypothetical protein